MRLSHQYSIYIYVINKEGEGGSNTAEFFTWATNWKGVLEWEVQFQIVTANRVAIWSEHKPCWSINQTTALRHTPLAIARNIATRKPSNESGSGTQSGDPPNLRAFYSEFSCVTAAVRHVKNTSAGISISHAGCYRFVILNSLSRERIR